jgi:AraC-like DNA-binding protein
MLEFLHYDRSIVLAALGDHAAANASYRRYLRCGAWNHAAPEGGGSDVTKRPLEPYFLKRADRFIEEHLCDAFGVDDLARHCGVSRRTLQAAFAKFRGFGAVAHVRNVRLDHAHVALADRLATVKEVALKFGFRSPTTFALEYRKRFGVPPSRRKSFPS